MQKLSVKLAGGSPTVDLKAALSTAAMTRAWKTVRIGLRRQPITDLHDFLDVHRTFETFAERIRADVLAGNYRPVSPEFGLLEKGDGITRRLAIPVPGDALLLQCIVDVLESRVKESQPHPNSYYSRSHTPESVEAVDQTFGYAWWVLWPAFQQRIFRFTSEFPFVVVADVANYFDCIPLPALRHTVAACGQFHQTFLDFLFFMLESFCWRPSYMPPSGVGLPQLDFDAPRLLAHAYLFRIDEVLAKATDGNFVRWMDDIDAGVASREEGKLLLRNLEMALNSVGLRLNSNKSRIFSAEEAVAHFWLRENQALTIIENSISPETAPSAVAALARRILRRRFREYWRQERKGHWDKVCKRYFKLFGWLKDYYLERLVPDLLANTPSLRGAAFRYLSVLGYSRSRLRIVRQFVASGHCEDDVSLFQSARCLVDWHPPSSVSVRSELVAIAGLLSRKASETSAMAGSLWIVAKYGAADDLKRLVRGSAAVWSKSQWAARQVAAVTPLLEAAEQAWVNQKIIEGGLLNALGVLAHLEELGAITALDPQLKSYLFHQPVAGHAYPLEKVLIARTVTRAPLTRAVKDDLRKKMAAIVGDRHYVRLLRTRRSSR